MERESRSADRHNGNKKESLSIPRNANTSHTLGLAAHARNSKQLEPMIIHFPEADAKLKFETIFLTWNDHATRYSKKYCKHWFAVTQHK